MSLVLYGHPFSSYCQKVEVALYENGLPFQYRIIAPENPEASADWAPALAAEEISGARRQWSGGCGVEHHHRAP